MSFRALVVFAGFSLFLAALGTALLDCKPLLPEDARDPAREVLSDTNVACIAARQFLPDSEVARLCGIVGPFLGPMKNVLAGARAEHKLAGAARGCP